MSLKIPLFLGCIFISLHTSFSSPSYINNFTIVLVEFRTEEIPNSLPSEILSRNGERYVEIVRSVLKYKPTIIVFPEGTLDQGRSQNTVDFSFSFFQNDNPCLSKSASYPKFLIDLSCLAKANSLTIILNLIQYIDKIYENRDVEIIPDGSLMSRLSKGNRMAETGLDETNPKSKKYKFRQDLAYKQFGLASFDHLFKIIEPDNIWVAGITNFIISSKWINELPFLTTFQIAHMWAYEEHLNLYISGANEPNQGIGGTGIFLGTSEPAFMDILYNKQQKVYVYRHDDSNSTHFGKLLTVKDIDSLDGMSKEMDHVVFRADDNFGKYTTKVMDTDKDDIVASVCHSEPNYYMCCDFNIQIARTAMDHTKNSFYTYHLVAYSGSRNYFDRYQRHVEICGVVACLGSEKLSCGLRFADYSTVIWPVTFKKITIEAYFSTNKYRRQYPNTLLSNMRPIPSSHFSWMQNKLYSQGQGADSEGFLHPDRVRRQLSLRKPHNHLMTFAIYGRDLREHPDMTDRFGSAPQPQATINPGIVNNKIKVEKRISTTEVPVTGVDFSMDIKDKVSASPRIRLTKILIICLLLGCYVVFKLL